MSKTAAAAAHMMGSAAGQPIDRCSLPSILQHNMPCTSTLKGRIRRFPPVLHEETPAHPDFPGSTHHPIVHHISPPPSCAPSTGYIDNMRARIHFRNIPFNSCWIQHCTWPRHCFHVMVLFTKIERENCLFCKGIAAPAPPQVGTSTSAHRIDGGGEGEVVNSVTLIQLFIFDLCQHRCDGELAGAVWLISSFPFACFQLVFGEQQRMPRCLQRTCAGVIRAERERRFGKAPLLLG
ncbi:hypothetical protein GQ54DRAFT_25095 [Martensiomyces pterosporus]|nr:hypothetical protein GQ54DRAFT_25095 [Martensiomyces pterosporus]